MENELHPPDDFSHRFFIWHEWIQANGPLTAENVFDYFSHSMFYDKQSNNQVLRMQTMHTGQPILNEAEELKRFTGVEFAVVHSEPPSLFIIHKRERLSPTEVRPLAAYFIMNNRIYQSPDLYTVLSNRLSSLDTLRTYRPAYTPRTGFVWPIMEAEPTPSISDELNKKSNASTDSQEPPESTQDSNMKRKLTGALSGDGVAVGSGKKQQNNLLLFNAMRTTATHASTTFASNKVAMDQGVSEQSGEGITTSVARTSVTPAPANVSTPKVLAIQAGPGIAGTGTQETGKSAQAGGVKKKRKRNNTTGAPSAA